MYLVCTFLGSLLVGQQLEAVQGALRQCRQQLHQQCRRLALAQKQDKPVTSSGEADLLAQLQQLEQERLGLME